MRVVTATVCVIVALLAGGCGDDDGVCTGERLPGHPQLLFGGDRPVEIRVPEDYDPTCPTPLLLVLHGHGVSGAIQAVFWDLDRFVQDERVIVAAPDGTFDDRGRRFWNWEHPALCCDTWPQDVDDVAYLSDLLDEISGVYNIDADRVYVLGHSNGGMMSYRLACDLGDRFAAVVSLAGPSMGDLAGCVEQGPSVLHIHGTADDTVLYDGGTDLIGGGGGAYLGAQALSALWATHRGCDGSLVAGGRLDLDGTLEGDETVVERFPNCPGTAAVELWTLEGGVHMPNVTARGLPTIWPWLMAHPRAD